MHTMSSSEFTRNYSNIIVCGDAKVRMRRDTHALTTSLLERCPVKNIQTNLPNGHQQTVPSTDIVEL